MTITPGTRLGPYEVSTPIGAGGMGEVYEAHDTRLGRTVAPKVLPEHLAQDAGLRERFEREARAVSSLKHPHICTLFDVGEHEGEHYLVMEYLEGETLADRLERGPLPLDEALDVAGQIADALAAAHRSDIVHRDLKPGNVMMTKSGVKLLDFGLAKVREEVVVSGEGSEQPTRNKPLTNAGTILGTLQYMAPEQLEGKEVDARADLFALGAILFEMITGRRAFEGESQASLISAILSAEPPPVSELEAVSPPALDRLVRRCLGKDPEHRWHSDGSVRFDVERLEIEGEPVPVVEGIHVSIQNFSSQYTFSATGVLAYVPSEWEAFRRRLVWVDRNGHVEPIQAIPRRITNPRISPNGDLIAVSIFDGVQPGVWLAEAARDTLRPLDREWSMSPTWSPGGDSVAFVTQGTIATKSVDVGNAPRMTVAAVHSLWDSAWSPDGDVILLSVIDQQSLNTWSKRIDSGDEPVPVLDTPANEGQAGFSPDGRWFVYSSNESGRGQIYVQSFGDQGRKRQISTDGGQAPVWSPLGNEVFYRRGRAMMSVEVETDPVFRASTPRVLFEGDFLHHDLVWKRNYDVSPDGQRFLMIESESAPDYAKIQLVFNWFEELKRLVPMDQ